MTFNQMLQLHRALRNWLYLGNTANKIEDVGGKIIDFKQLTDVEQDFLRLWGHDGNNLIYFNEVNDELPELCIEFPEEIITKILVLGLP
jgi:hypothetical protein